MEKVPLDCKGLFCCSSTVGYWEEKLLQGWLAVPHPVHKWKVPITVPNRCFVQINFQTQLWTLQWYVPLPVKHAFQSESDGCSSWFSCLPPPTHDFSTLQSKLHCNGSTRVFIECKQTLAYYIHYILRWSVANFQKCVWWHVLPSLLPIPVPKTAGCSWDWSVPLLNQCTANLTCMLLVLYTADTAPFTAARRPTYSGVLCWGQLVILFSGCFSHSCNFVATQSYHSNRMTICLVYSGFMSLYVLPLSGFPLTDM